MNALPHAEAASAEVSTDGRYRYELRRIVAPLYRGTVCWIGFNPSTADAEEDDATIRLVSGFTRRWGYRDLVVVNRWPLRDTDPAGVDIWRTFWSQAEEDAVTLNDAYIDRATGAADLVIAAWGALGNTDSYALRERLDRAGIKLHALGFTNAGHPRHPRGVLATAQPIPWPLS
jgi:hypothetical protein